MGRWREITCGAGMADFTDFAVYGELARRESRLKPQIDP